MGFGTDSGSDLRDMPYFRDTTLLRSFRATCSHLGESAGGQRTTADTLARSQSEDCVLQQGPLSGELDPHVKLEYLYVRKDVTSTSEIQAFTRDIPQKHSKAHKYITKASVTRKPQDSVLLSDLYRESRNEKNEKLETGPERSLRMYNVDSK